MIHCNLSTILGTKRLKISDVSKATGLNRSTITVLYNDTAKRIDLKAIYKICKFLECGIDELFTIQFDD
ncbi:XRE family transcriptional regulator [Lewinellaceae bacterium SD302]|nr:XRE family transcriptional regulator [Lewinellaceae bacterium SD302]